MKHKPKLNPLFTYIFEIHPCYPFQGHVVQNKLISDSWVTHSCELNLFNECIEKRKSYRFERIWEWVNDDRNVIFGWTIPWSVSINFLHLCLNSVAISSRLLPQEPFLTWPQCVANSEELSIIVPQSLDMPQQFYLSIFSCRRKSHMLGNQG